MATSTSARDPHAVLKALNATESAPAAAVFHVQRHYARHSIRGDALLQQLNESVVDQPPIRISLRDVSLGGLGFTCDRPLKVGGIWRAVFTVKGYHFGQQGLRVCHCRTVADGLYLIGGQFCLEPAVLCLLGVDPVQLAAPDAGPAKNCTSDSFVSPGEV